MEIEKRQEIDGKYFNFWLYQNYDISSVVSVNEKIKITGNLDLVQQQQIKDFYNSLEPYVFNDEYMTEFLKGKYALNAERGAEYAHEISAKIVMLIESGDIELEVAVSQTEESEKVISELRKGYYHSAYLFHVSYIPITELAPLHSEIKNHLKEYINNHYPPTFHVE